ncbi:transcription initiation factor TFIIB, partial [Tremellales sp. Uapishka_1]
MMGVAAPRPQTTKYGQAVAPNLAVRHICPNCRNDPPNIVEESSKGDLVCGDCGTILGDRVVDTRSEWRTFAGDEGDDPSRVGGPQNALLGSNVLETTVSFRDGKTGISQNLLRAQARANAQGGGMNGKTSIAVLQAVFAKIAERCDAMQLPRTISESAKHVYKIADERKATRSKKEAAVIAACIVYACRAAGAGRSFSEICNITKVSKKELGAVFLSVKQVLHDYLEEGGSDAFLAGQSSTKESAEGLLGRYCNHLDLGNTVLNASKYIAVKAVEKSAIDGRSPVSIAAGVLFFTCTLLQNPTTAHDISQVASVSESTIKLIRKLVASNVDLVVRPEWKTDYAVGYAALSALGKVAEAPVKGSRAGTPSTNAPTPKEEA